MLGNAFDCWIGGGRYFRRILDFPLLVRCPLTSLIAQVLQQVPRREHLPTLLRAGPDVGDGRDGDRRASYAEGVRCK